MKLVALAVQAQDDTDALQVLGDAILESGWWDVRVQHLCVDFDRRGKSLRKSGRRNMRWFQRNASEPTREWARAVLAVLLCEGWQDTTWPVWLRAKRPPPKPGEMAAILRRLWPQQRITESLYAERPFFEMVRRGA